jgi:hypothetical protein
MDIDTLIVYCDIIMKRISKRGNIELEQRNCF